MSFNKRMLSAGAASLVPSEHFNIVTYTGTSAAHSITGVGFQPDLVWIKDRSNTEQHILNDSTRGATKDLSPNSSAGEATRSTGFTSFNSDGFSLGTDGGGVVNDSSRGPYVAWCWKANGGTTSTNTDGSINTTVQTNTDAGFSIIKYTGNGTVGATIGHNLGVVPNWFMVKKLGSGTTNWRTYHTYVDTGGNPQNFNVEINGNGVLDDRTEWNDTMPTSSVISLNAHESVNENGTEYICYAWNDVANFSKFNYYTGTGDADDTPVIETGFEPAFVMIKVVNGNTGNWNIYDNKRNTTNPRKKYLIANGTAADNESSADNVDFLSNGFQIGPTTDSNLNVSGNRYIYMAFAANADEESPTLASSFNIETYTGTGSSGNSIFGLGFEPSFLWLKSRSGAVGDFSHTLMDTVRGASKSLSSNNNNAEVTNANGLESFDTDGFTVGSGAGGWNYNGSHYAAWAFKADDNEPTILPNTELSSLISKYEFESYTTDSYGDNDGTASNVSYVQGKYQKKAADFNGSSSKILYPQAAPFNDSNTILAISAWVKLDSASDEFVIMSASSTSDQADYMMLVAGGSKPGRIFMTDAPSNANEYQASFGSSNDTNWNHYVWQLSASGGIELWYNGTKQTRTQTYQAGSLDETKWFGDLTYATGVQYATGINRVVTTGYSNGSIDQMRLFNDELTSSEISDLYNEGNQAIVSVNANAGFSIAEYTGNGLANNKIPHGLSSTPQLVIIKNLNDSEDWQAFGSTVFDRMQLNNDGTDDGNYPLSYTATTITLPQGGQEANNAWNAAGDEYIMYCWHSVTGYSKVGSYTGVEAGVTVTTGFTPDFLLIKSTSNVEHWAILDTLRGSKKVLNPNRDVAEGDSALNTFTVSSTGFSFPHQDTADAMLNENGYTYSYLAVAKNVPSNTTLADSFTVKTYTGNGGTNSITGLGFKPDLIWLKNRDTAVSHTLFDTLRGPGTVNQLYSDDTDAMGNDTTLTNLTSFDSDGFTLGATSGYNVPNNSGDDYIAWCWKAGNQWQSNTNGTQSSLVNANTANGFSIVKWNGNGSASATVGHGLSSKPDWVIVKDLTEAGGWNVAHVGLASNEGISLNSSAAAFTSMGNNGGITYGNLTATTFGFATGAVGVDSVNKSGNDYIAYCWHSVSGFSKIGSYSGTGSSNSITGLGFGPNLLIIKEADGTDSWEMYDSLRGSNKVVYPNGSNAEVTGSTLTSFDSNGFTVSSATSINENGKTYLYMAFKMNPTPVVAAGKFSFLVVAGGGAGGGSYGGGGGAGGLRTSFGSSSGGGASVLSEETLSNGTYTITVGAGGSGVSSTNAGNDGSTSSITGNSSISTTAGGGGGTAGGANGYNTSTIPGRNGGSGGGGGVLAQTSPYTSAGGTGATGQGFGGGTGGLGSFNGTTGAGGGGGASEAGDNGKTSGYRLGGNGGDGLTVDINNDSAAYAGGGGAGSEGSTNATAGNGGGGTGGYTSASAPTNGTANTGGGGGGVGNTSSVTSGAGGSGVVILRMRTSDYSGTTTGSPTVTVLGDETILKYTGSGTYVHS